MGQAPFFQTPFGIFTAGLILQVIIASFLVGRIYQRFRDQQKMFNGLFFILGKHDRLLVSLNTILRDHIKYADTKIHNPHRPVGHENTYNSWIKQFEDMDLERTTYTSWLDTRLEELPEKLMI